MYSVMYTLMNFISVYKDIEFIIAFKINLLSIKLHLESNIRVSLFYLLLNEDIVFITDFK